MCVTPSPVTTWTCSGATPWRRCEQVRVDADLEQRAALDGPSELRVGDLVAPRPEARGSIDPEQEVGVADPAAVEERGLVDDVGTAAHRGQRRGLRRVERAAERRGRARTSRSAIVLPSARRRSRKRCSCSMPRSRSSSSSGSLRWCGFSQRPWTLPSSSVARWSHSQEPDEVRRADDDAAVRVSLHGAWIPLLGSMARVASGDSARRGDPPCGWPGHAQGQDGEAGARERHGDDEHQRRGHDAEEDGRGCQDGGEGFSMTLHGSTVAPGRATLHGTSSACAQDAPARRAEPSYDATMRTGACLILAACLVAACGGGASRSAASTAPPTPSGRRGPSTPPRARAAAPTASPSRAQTPSAEAPTPGPTVAGPSGPGQLGLRGRRRDPLALHL